MGQPQIAKNPRAVSSKPRIQIRSPDGVTRQKSPRTRGVAQATGGSTIQDVEEGVGSAGRMVRLAGRFIAETVLTRNHHPPRQVHACLSVNVLANSTNR
jgi:hypothetical protein